VSVTSILRGKAALLVAMVFTASTSLTAMVKAALDVSLIGKLGSSELAAFAYVFPILFLLISVGNGVYIATAACFVGADRIADRRVLLRPFIHSMMVSITLGAVVAIAMRLLLPALLRAMGADDHLVRLDGYFSIWLWTVPMMFVSANTFAIIRNLGYLKIASAITFAATVVGVMLSYLLIPAGEGETVWGIVGSAYSTFATSALSTLISVGFVLFRSRYGGVGEFWAEFAELARRILGIGLPVLLSNVLLFFFLSLVTRVFSGFGQDAVAAYGINGRVEQVLLIFQSAFVTVAIPALTRSWADGDHEGFRRYTGEVARLMLLFAIVLAALVFLLRHWIADIAAPTPITREICLFYLCIVPFTVGFQGVFMLATTILNLLKKSRKSLLWYAVNYAVVNTPVLVLLGSFWDVRVSIVGLAFCSVVCGLLAWRMVDVEITRSARDQRSGLNALASAATAEVAA
jgi:Na+-driven multidrug efflux pump